MLASFLLPDVPGPIWGCQQKIIEFAIAHLVAQAVQARPRQNGAAVAVVTKDVVVRQRPPLGIDIGAQTGQLLLNRLQLDLMARRHPNIECYSHGKPPAKVGPVAVSPLPTDVLVPIAAGVGMLDPSVADHSLARSLSD